VTNEGMRNLAEGASEFVETAMKDSPIMKIIQGGIAEARGGMPEMPPVRKAKAVAVPVEVPGGMTILEEPKEPSEALGKMEPQTDDPWQEPNHEGPNLTPFETCKHNGAFIAKDATSMLDMVLRLGYKKVHIGKFRGAGFYCADCLHRVE